MSWFIIKRQAKKPLRIFPELRTYNCDVALWHSQCENSLNSPFIFIVARTFLRYRENISGGLWSLSTESDSRKPESTMLVADREKWKPFSLVVELAGRSDGDRTVSHDTFFQKHHAIPQSWQIPSWNKACFKRRATDVLIWLDCSSTAARH